MNFNLLVWPNLNPNGAGSVSHINELTSPIPFYFNRNFIKFVDLPLQEFIFIKDKENSSYLISSSKNLHFNTDIKFLFPKSPHFIHSYSDIIFILLYYF